MLSKAVSYFRIMIVRRCWLLLALAIWPRMATAGLTGEIARLATPLVDASGADTNRAVGLVVAVASRDVNQVFGFGALRAGGTNAPDGGTFFQIGSVSKALTGLLLASLAEDSAVAVDPNSPANSHLATDVRLPDFQGQPITLAQLASHYASLPEMPTNLTGPPTSPAAGYTRTQLADYLSTLTLSSAPGSAYRYSNLGYGVLAVALVDSAAAVSYAALLNARLTGPLGMNDTGLNEAGFVSQLGNRLAQGYRVAGGNLVEVGLSDMGALEGAGEVISTGDDLRKLLRAWTGLDAFPVAGAVERALTPVAAGAAGNQIGYGMDIVTLADGTVQHEKAGVVAGYTCYVAFRRAPAVGVAICSNRGQHQAIQTLARQLVALLPPPPLTIQRDTSDVAAVSFPAQAGQSYELQTSSNLVNWTSLVALTNGAGNITHLTVPLPLTNCAAFFRVRF